MPLTRAERRARTQERVLDSARRLFAERGYGATSIRAIAEEADTDPALVMRYFGSKAELFERTSALRAESPGDAAATPPQIAEALRRSLTDKLAAPPAELLAALRSMLAHPDAVPEVAEVMRVQQQAVADRLTAPDPELRAALVGALTVGVVLGRYVLNLDGLRDAAPDDVLALLGPVFTALLDPPPSPSP